MLLSDIFDENYEGNNRHSSSLFAFLLLGSFKFSMRCLLQYFVLLTSSRYVVFCRLPSLFLE